MAETLAHLAVLAVLFGAVVAAGVVVADWIATPKHPRNRR